MMYIPRDEGESAKETILKISKIAFHYLWGRTQVMILPGEYVLYHFSTLRPVL